MFLQQLGRGLRTYKGKEYLNVLDFIGNYEKAGKVPMLLGGEGSFSGKGDESCNNIAYPDDCIVDFDVRLIDLFKELDKKSLTMKERINQEYFRVKELLDGKISTRMEKHNKQAASGESKGHADKVFKGIGERVFY